MTGKRRFLFCPKRFNSMHEHWRQCYRIDETNCAPKEITLTRMSHAPSCSSLRAHIKFITQSLFKLSIRQSSPRLAEPIKCSMSLFPRLKPWIFQFSQHLLSKSVAMCVPSGVCLPSRFDRWKIKPSKTCVVASVRAIILEIRKHDVKHDELEAPTPKWH